jgi:SAM-dependent methyltransferase
MRTTSAPAGPSELPSTSAGRTDAEFWDAYWQEVALPVEVSRPTTVHETAILDVLDAYLPEDHSAAVAEIGGAPGAYLAYLAKTHGFRVASIDYSDVGCAKTVENFRQLGIDGEVYKADLFDDATPLPAFDAVFSLGLIEHFPDFSSVVERHVRLVRPGGRLVIGVPNLRGLHGWFLRRLAPSLYATHEIAAMNLDAWTEFEKALQLEVLFKGYVGGFEPRIFRRMENATARNRVLHAGAVGLSVTVHRLLPALRRINGPRASGYAIAAYQVPA